MIVAGARHLKRAIGLKGIVKGFSSNPGFAYQELFDLSNDHKTTYKKLTGDYVSTVKLGNTEFLKVEPEGLRLLSAQAMTDISHLLRPAHLQQLSNILKDKEATENDKFVALELLKNANIAANFVLPSCQDTGTCQDQLTLSLTDSNHYYTL
jgi:fumarate hydratase class I